MKRLIIAIITLLSCNANAREVRIYPGTQCKAERPTEVKYELGGRIMNRSSTPQSFWCPLIRTQADLTGYTRVIDEHPSSNVRCWLYTANSSTNLSSRFTFDAIFKETNNASNTSGLMRQLLFNSKKLDVKTGSRNVVTAYTTYNMLCIIPGLYQGKMSGIDMIWTQEP